MIEHRQVWAILGLGMALCILTMSAYGDGELSCPIKPDVGGEWLATGTITKVDGPAFYMLGKDNQVYEVRAGGPRTIVNDIDGGRYTPTVGNTIKVFGKAAKGCLIDASRVRVLPERLVSPTDKTVTLTNGASAVDMPLGENKIVIEREPGQTPVIAQPPAALPAIDWVGRGLIMDIDYTGRALKVRTTSGQYTVHITGSKLLNGSKQIKLGVLNLGDAVMVCGNLCGPFEVSAQEVRVTRTRDEAQNALPQRPASIMGIIDSIDYPSMTFTMQAAGPTIVVLADRDTVFQHQMCSMTFADLKPGMRVKMSGYGNIGNGYVAQYVLIISL